MSRVALVTGSSGGIGAAICKRLETDGLDVLAHKTSPERVLEDVVLAPHAIKRLIEPEEVADVVSFLVGPGGRTFTGAAVTMDMGWTAR